MKPALLLSQVMFGSTLLAWSPLIFAGTWADRFSEDVLGADWQGDRDYFSIVDGALDGISVSPLAPAPFHRVEVGDDWADYTIQCLINPVEPNLLVCTKGALVLRDNGSEGYVFALHVATQTIEVYRLSDQEMLLSTNFPLELKTWYLARAQLDGPAMTFFVDNQWIGTVTDDLSLSGGAGIAVQDAQEVLFDDFTVTGPGIPGNGLELSLGQKVVLSWPSSLTNSVLEETTELSPTTVWTIVTNTVTTHGSLLTVTMDPSPGNHFYILVPK